MRPAGEEGRVSGTAWGSLDAAACHAAHRKDRTPSELMSKDASDSVSRSLDELGPKMLLTGRCRETRTPPKMLDCNMPFPLWILPDLLGLLQHQASSCGLVFLHRLVCGHRRWTKKMGHQT